MVKSSSLYGSNMSSYEEIFLLKTGNLCIFFTSLCQYWNLAQLVGVRIYIYFFCSFPITFDSLFDSQYDVQLLLGKYCLVFCFFFSSDYFRIPKSWDWKPKKQRLSEKKKKIFINLGKCSISNLRLIGSKGIEYILKKSCIQRQRISRRVWIVASKRVMYQASSVTCHLSPVTGLLTSALCSFSCYENPRI